jgi:hypothetical protein
MSPYILHSCITSRVNIPEPPVEATRHIHEHECSRNTHIHTYIVSTGPSKKRAEVTGSSVPFLGAT